MIKRETKNQKQKHQIFCMKILLQKKPQLHYQRIIQKPKNYNTYNQDNLIKSDMLEIGPLKDDSKIEQLNDNSKYISCNDVDKLQDNFFKKW